MSAIEQVLRRVSTDAKRKILFNLAQMDIGETGDLLRSIDTEYEANELDSSITLQYHYVTRFVELGTGRGVPLPKVPASARSPKLFLAPVVEETIQLLADEMTGVLADELILKVFPKFD